MFSPIQKLEIPNDFQFPFKPYKIQDDLMQALYSVIENKEIGIFESPTGTGKSLTLTCAALKWLEDHENLVKNEIEVKLKELEKEINDLETDSSKSNDWIEVQFGAIQKKNELLSCRKMKSQIEEHEKKITELKNRIAKEKKINSFKFSKKNDSSSKNSDDFQTEETSGKKKIDEDDDDLLLAESDDENYENDADRNVDEDKFRDVKIYFSSRTHSQLSQVVREIKRTSYGKHIRCITLASRQNLCINPIVKQLGTVSLINERCLDMQKSQSKSTLNDKEGRTQKKSRTKCITKCSYKNSITIEELRDNSLVEIHDIEDLVSAGQVAKACPFYSGREAQKDAQIIMLPYQMLLHRKTRIQTGIDLRNSVVIIDEAHNLLDTISNIYSSEINLDQLQTALSQLQAYKMKYCSRFAAKNLFKLNQLIYIVKKLTKMLMKTSGNDSLPNSRMIKTYELMHESEFYNLNLFDILEFCEKSRLAQKVHGLAQRMPVQEKQEESIKSEVKSIENTKSLLRRLEEKTKNKKPKKVLKQSNAEAKKVTKLEEEKEISKKNYQKKITSSVIRPLLTFLESLTECADDGMILIKYDVDNKKTGMKFVLLNPGGHFQEIINECRSVIIAGGTMQPTNELIKQLFKSCLDRVRQHFYDHVVPSESVNSFIVQKGPTSKQLLFNFTNRYNLEMLNELGLILENICNIIPAGIVCFFGSYDYLDYVYTHFTNRGILKKIEQHKFIFREPRSSSIGINGEKSIDKILNDYNRTIRQNKERNGAILFSVIGGKLSEGLNFSDDLGRCIIIIGMPYPNKNSSELIEKMKYLNENFGNGTGNDYYENLCMKAVNQSIGRAIRHINDYASVLLLDERYSSDKIKNKLPKWISKNLKITNNFCTVQNSITKFFNNKCQSKN